MGRKISIVGYAVVAAAICFLGGVAVQATVLKIDPRCAKSSDKLGCTCARLGGRIYTDGGRTWCASARNTDHGGASDRAFTQWLIDNGGH
jgi:hypothetical protein